MYGNADTLAMLARTRQADLLREVERDRLAKVARETATAYRERRTDLRLRQPDESLLDRLVGRLKGSVTPAQPRALTREPAV